MKLKLKHLSLLKQHYSVDNEVRLRLNSTNLLPLVYSTVMYNVL